MGRGRSVDRQKKLNAQRYRMLVHLNNDECLLYWKHVVKSYDWFYQLLNSAQHPRGRVEESAP